MDLFARAEPGVPRRSAAAGGDQSGRCRSRHPNVLGPLDRLRRQVRRHERLWSQRPVRRSLRALRHQRRRRRPSGTVVIDMKMAFVVVFTGVALLTAEARSDDPFERMAKATAQELRTNELFKQQDFEIFVAQPFVVLMTREPGSDRVASDARVPARGIGGRYLAQLAEGSCGLAAPLHPQRHLGISRAVCLGRLPLQRRLRPVHDGVPDPIKNIRQAPGPTTAPLRVS